MARRNLLSSFITSEPVAPAAAEARAEHPEDAAAHAQ
jgi:hypothetical protein